MKYCLGVYINSIENVFLGGAMFFLALYLIALAIEKKPTWFLSKRFLYCREIEYKYAKLIDSRRDVLHHYYWAKSNGYTKKMKDMVKDMDRIDSEMHDLKMSYERIKAGLPVPLRAMV